MPGWTLLHTQVDIYLSVQTSKEKIVKYAECERADHL